MDAACTTTEKKPHRAKKQRKLLDIWIKALTDIPQIKLIWIEGSMVNVERENPGSDIDIRFAIEDEAFDELWDSNRHLVFEALGDVLPLAPFRIVTEGGILIEFDACKVSELENKSLYEWEVLLDRLPEGQLNFIKETTVGPEAWPHPQEIRIEAIRDLTADVLRRLTTASTPFFYTTAHSALFELQLLRHKVMYVLYWRSGMKPFMRAKHLNEVLTPEFFADYEYIQFRDNEHSLQHSAVAKATLRTYETLEKHCKALYQHMNCLDEYPKKWFTLLNRQLHTELQPFVNEAQNPSIYK